MIFSFVMDDHKALRNFRKVGRTTSRPVHVSKMGSVACSHLAEPVIVLGR